MKWVTTTAQTLIQLSDAYAPLDFSGMAPAKPRVGLLPTVADDMDRYTDYAMGQQKEQPHAAVGQAPRGVSPKTLFDCMRDHYEGPRWT